MLKLNPHRQYRKSTGKLIFVYKVEGDKKELDKYVAAKVKEGAPEKSIRTEDGVLFYSQRFIAGRNIVLAESAQTPGKFFPDTDKQDQVLNLIQQGFDYTAACAMVGSKVAVSTEEA